MGFLEDWNSRSADKLGADHIFRPRLAWFAAAVWAIVTVLWLVLAAGSGVRELLAQLPIAAFFGVLVYAMFVRPLVAVRPRDIVLRNVFRDITVEWGALEDIGTKYALSLTDTAGRKHTAWAAPAASRFSTARTTSSDLKTLQWPASMGPVPASASLRSDSGAAAAVIRTGWSAATARGDVDGSAVTIRWNAPLIGAALATLLVSVLVLALR